MTHTNGQPGDTEQIEAIELPLLLKAMAQRYGYDFRDYAVASLKRRLRRAMYEYIGKFNVDAILILQYTSAIYIHQELDNDNQHSIYQQPHTSSKVACRITFPR